MIVVYDLKNIGIDLIQNKVLNHFVINEEKK
jgi:hypothetical protein